MKRALRETQTLHASRSKAEPKFFAPLPGGMGWPKNYLQTQFGEDRCMQFRVIMVTDPQTNTPTNTQTHTNPQTGLITYYTVLQLASVQCKNTV